MVDISVVFGCSSERKRYVIVSVVDVSKPHSRWHGDLLRSMQSEVWNRMLLQFSESR